MSQRLRVYTSAFAERFEKILPQEIARLDLSDYHLSDYHRRLRITVARGLESSLIDAASTSFALRLFSLTGIDEEF